MKTQESLIFFQGMERLLRAGLGLIPTLELQAREHPRLAQGLSQVLASLRAGQALSQALRQYLGLPHLLWVYILLGEETGDLQGACELCVKTLEDQQAWRRLIWQLSFYPLLLICTSIGLMIVMLGLVLPEFASLYQTLNLSLPQSTIWLLSSATWAPGILNQAGITLSILCFGICMIWRKPEGRFTLERLVFRLPGFRAIFSQPFEYQLCLQLGTLLKAGLPLLQALDFMQQGVRSPWFAHTLREVKQRIHEGQSLGLSFSQTWSLSAPFKVLLSHAEMTGQLDEVLLSLAHQHKSNLKHRQDRAKHLIQPLITLLMGGFLGFWILLLYYPMLQLGTNLG